MSSLDFGKGRAGIGLGLGDQRALQLQLALGAFDSGRSCGDISTGLFDAGAIVTVLDPEERLSGFDRLIVINLDARDIARDLRRNERHVGTHIGVVRRFEEPAQGPPPPAIVAAIPERGAGSGPDHQVADELLHRPMDPSLGTDRYPC